MASVYSRAIYRGADPFICQQNLSSQMKSGRKCNEHTVLPYPTTDSLALYCQQGWLRMAPWISNDAKLSTDTILSRKFRGGSSFSSLFELRRNTLWKHIWILNSHLPENACWRLRDKRIAKDGHLQDEGQ